MLISKDLNSFMYNLAPHPRDRNIAPALNCGFFNTFEAMNNSIPVGAATGPMKCSNHTTLALRSDWSYWYLIGNVFSLGWLVWLWLKLKFPDFLGLDLVV